MADNETPITELLAELQRLYEATTECEWKRYNDNYEQGSSLIACDVTNSSGCVIADSIESQSDATWIAAAHNAFPRISRALEEARAENELVKSHRGNLIQIELAVRKDLATAQVELAAERSAREKAEAQNEEEKSYVDRVWKALGIETYEQAKPLAIDEHVARLRAALAGLSLRRFPDNSLCWCLEWDTIKNGHKPECTAAREALKGKE